MPRPALDLSIFPADLAEVVALHQQMFGTTLMEATNSGSEGAAGGQSGDQSGAGSDQSQQGQSDLGFPANTPTAEMTLEQQVAYYKHQSRKNEDKAKRTKDYDKVVAERDRLRQERMTEDEKAIEAAKQAGRSEGLKESGSRIVDAYVTARLSDRAGDVLTGLNKSAFLDDAGELKIDDLNRYLGVVAPQQQNPPRDPNQGRHPAGPPVSQSQRGRDEAARRFGNKK